VEIPLVFWNAARIAVGTNGKYLTAAVDPNPERYNPSARRVITKADPNGTIENGVIMWYRSEIPLGPADDTEDQLAEWTIRDHKYLTDTSLAHENYNIPDNQLLRLINYDVSNVDTLYLPLAMQATDTWVVPQATNPNKPGVDPNKPNLTGGYSPGSVENPFGWTGAIIKIDDLQVKIRKFAENNTENGLGQYFGGKGWPFYNFPGALTDPNVKIKIPSGANIFPQSPFSNGNGSRSSYNNEKYLLSSGGTGLISETIGAEGSQTGLSNNQVRLSLGDSFKDNKIDFVKEGYVVRANPPCEVLPPPGQPCVHFRPNAIQDGSTVTAIDPGEPPPPKGRGIPPVVTLSKELVAGRTMVGSSVTFSRKKEDYAAEAMIKLWFSWAQYYLDHWKDPQTCPPSCPAECPPLCVPTGETTIDASNDKETATLRFAAPHFELIKGMAVTGPHLNDAQTEVGEHQGDAVILDIAGDGKSVVLSQVMRDSSGGPKPFTFSPPKELLWTPNANTQPVGFPLFGKQFNFSNEPDCRPKSPNRNKDECRHDPYDFSQQVYLIMASMNQIGEANNNNVFKFMQDIIGANMGFIFTQKAKESEEGKMVTSMIRDMIKSVLRGVSDFTKYPDLIDNANNNHKSWYPDPAKASGGQSFNVFNLDPFVWFVHVKLGFSGYGFSVDDDTADIGSEGQSLQLSIAGKGGLKNNLTGEPEEWSIQAPFGPLKDIPVLYSGSVHDTRTTAQAKREDPPPPQHPKETLYNNISNVSHTTPITITNAGGQHPLANGDKVYIEGVKGENAANGWFKVGNVTTTTFSLFEDNNNIPPTPIAPTGTYEKKTGKWSYPLHPYLRITAGGPKTDPKLVFNRVKGDDALGTFQGTFVSVNGVDHNPLTTQNPSEKKFRVWQLGPSDEGILILDAHLTEGPPSGNPLGLGDYKVTFFGIPGPGIAQP
jgi:hypothetical protein